MKNPSSIVCCTPGWGENWQWFAPELNEYELNWHFHYDKPRGILERNTRFSGVRTCLEAVLSAKQHQADLLIAHNPRLSFWCAFFAFCLGVKTKHIAYSFNFHEMPHGLKRQLMKMAFKKINQFIVYSKLEKQLYSDYFEIPQELIETKLWTMKPPNFAPQEPLEEGDYICAIGGNARDYKTLMAAMEKLPDLKMIIVVRPSNLKNLKIPANVKALVNISEPHAMNILKHSRFMVLSLKGAEIPCGHYTLVSAMHLGKGFIVTNSHGVSDYVIENYNGITCKPFAPDALAEAINNLWNDPEKSQKLGENGKQFAGKYCSENLSLQHLTNLLFAHNSPWKVYS